MFKLIKSIQLFNSYRKSIKINEKYLTEKYGLNIDLVDRLWTVIDLSDAPKDMIQQYGPALSEHEYKKFITNLMGDLPKLELNELVKIYELKKISTNKYGITLGFTQFNNVTYYLFKWLGIIALIALLIIGITIII